MGFLPLPNYLAALSIIHTPVINISYLLKTRPYCINDYLVKKPSILILSQNGIRGLKIWLDHYNLNKNIFDNLQFWTVGHRTHQCLIEELKINSKFPLNMTGEGLISELHNNDISNLLLISEKTLRKKLVDKILELGFNYDHFPVYETRLVKNKTLLKLFNNNLESYVVFTSPSIVEGFLFNLGWKDLKSMKARCISIGPTTTQYISEYKGEIFFESKSPNMANLYKHLIKKISI